MSGVEALDRGMSEAMRSWSPTHRWQMAEALFAALSPADRLAIAGITEERLATAVSAYRGTLANWSGEPARELAAGLLVALTGDRP